MDFEELLLQYDDPTDWECPPGFDYELAQNRFMRFVDALSAELGTEFLVETGSYIQDASFHSQISIPIATKQYTSIRFSNFGDMVTISNHERVPEQMSLTVQKLFAEHGYVYIPESVLRKPYTGRIPLINVSDIASWWIRYFDYM